MKIEVIRMSVPVKVLIAYDGSESSQRAVKYASKVLAQGRDAEAIVVTAAQSNLWIAKDGSWSAAPGRPKQARTAVRSTEAFQ